MDIGIENRQWTEDAAHRANPLRRMGRSGRCSNTYLLSLHFQLFIFLLTGTVRAGSRIDHDWI